MSDLDDRYATFREHAELRERTATLEATMLQVGPTLARIETMVASARQNAPQETTAAAALHNAADAIRSLKGGGNSSPILTVLAFVGAVAIGGGAVFFLVQ